MSIIQNSYITNNEKFIHKIINGILYKCSSVDILIGYFYYSSFGLICQNTKDEILRLFIGLTLVCRSLMGRSVNPWNNHYWILHGELLPVTRQSIFFKIPKNVIVKQTGNSTIGTIIEKNTIYQDKMGIDIPNNNSSNYILELLNSKLSNFFYSYTNPEQGEALVVVEKAHLKLLPIVSNKNAEKNLGENCNKIDWYADTSAIENKIDLMVYKLYNLTYD